MELTDNEQIVIEQYKDINTDLYCESNEDWQVGKQGEIYDGHF